MVGVCWLVNGKLMLCLVGRVDAHVLVVLLMSLFFCLSSGRV